MNFLPSLVLPGILEACILYLSVLSEQLLPSPPRAVTFGKIKGALVSHLLLGTKTGLHYPTLHFSQL